MCGYEFNLAAAGGAIAGAVLGHISSTSELAPSTIVHWTFSRSCFRVKVEFRRI